MSTERRKGVQPKARMHPIYPLPLIKPAAIRTDRKRVLALKRTERHWLIAESLWIRDTVEQWFCWADVPINLAGQPRPQIHQPLDPRHNLRVLELQLHFPPETPSGESDEHILVLGHLDPTARLVLPRNVTLTDPFLWWTRLPENKHAAKYLELARKADLNAYIAEQEEKAARRAARKAVA